MNLHLSSVQREQGAPANAGGLTTAADEVNNLDAITFLENRLRPLIATDNASV